MKDPPPVPPDGGGVGPDVPDMPQKLAIELLHSTDARIAAAAARVFSPRPKSETAASGSSGGCSPVMTASSAPAPASPPPSMQSTSTSMTPLPSEPTGFAKAVPHRKVPPANAASTSGTTDSSTAASALTAMATGAAFSSAPATTAGTTTTTVAAGAAAVSRLPGKKYSSTERLKRSRERNRMHARKTRQRKKEHMSILQARCEKLKNEQLRLKQAINEKNTASILLCMFGNAASSDGDGGSSSDVDPKVEALMKRSVDEIPDASKIPELPALILPGQHSSKKIREAASAVASMTASSADEADGSSSLPLPVHCAVNSKGQLPDDGIDYDLLSKDRSKCTPAELDQIRRERNRMHAKRTRDRKRIFMEEMEVMIKQLQGENKLLEDHLESLSDGNDKAPGSASTSSSTTPSHTPASPRMNPTSFPMLSPPAVEEDASDQQVRSLSPAASESSTKSNSNNSKKRPLPETCGQTQSPAPSMDSSSSGITVDQIKSILSTAGELEKNSAIAGMLTISSVASAVSAPNSDAENEQDGQDDDHDHGPSKRQCILPSSAPVPASC
mmetsp:Transcript_34097/g.68736  ORF Transcript_34097/g.68736 Transcript_34097/m.68736 type:complete len:559 (+) Transcript_34097:381-2057(+)